VVRGVICSLPWLFVCWFSMVLSGFIVSMLTASRYVSPDLVSIIRESPSSLVPTRFIVRVLRATFTSSGVFCILLYLV